jgi:hypothetical protein
MPLSALEQNRPEYVVSVLKKSDERRSLLAQQAKQLVEVATSPQQSFDRGKHHSATATAAALGLDDRHQSDEPREISSEGSDLDASKDALSLPQRARSSRRASSRRRAPE